MGAILAKLFGGVAGAAITNVGTVAAILAALGAAAMWLTGSAGEQVFITITYREAAFWFGILAIMVLVAKYSPAPRRDNLQDWRAPRE